MKKQLLVTLLAACAAIASAFALAGCGGSGDGGNGGDGKHNNTHVHNMTKIAAVTPDCTKAGNIQYWECSDCGKYYSDELGNNEITDKTSVTVPVNSDAHKWGTWKVKTDPTCTEKGEEVRVCSHNKSHTETRPINMISHNLTPVEAHSASCTEVGNTDYWECSVCHNYFNDAQGATKIEDKTSVEIAKLKHTVTPVEAKSASCTQTGNTAYWECSVCHNYFSDAQGATLIEDKQSVNIPKLAHTLTAVSAKQASCTQKGNQAYWECSVCHNYFNDAQGATLIEDKQSVDIAKLAHTYTDGSCTVCGGVQPTEGLKYEIDNKTAYVSGIGTATASEIIIADEYEGYPVTGIGSDAFSHEKTLTGVIIPDSVTSIGTYAFSNSGLKSVTIPDSITRIQSYTFSGCSHLTTVTIPESVTHINDYAFAQCSSLKIVNYKGSIASWCGISGLRNLFDFSTDKHLYIDEVDFKTATLDLVIPETVTSIADYAFYGCSGLKSVTISNGVTSIGNAAFMHCKGIKSITLPAGLKTLESSAFDSGYYIEKEVYYKGDLKGWCSITGLGTIMSYGTTLYISGQKLTGEIVIPDGITAIDNNAFMVCKDITSVIIPDSVTSIGARAFDSCNALTAVKFGKGVASIGASAFDYCNELKSIEVSKDNAVYVSQDGILYDKQTKDFLLIPINLEGEVTILDGVTQIAPNSFARCDKLTGITIPDSVTVIGSEAFYKCSALANLKIGNGVKRIESSAFQECKSLKSVIIPNGVTSIGNSAFYVCINLTSIVLPESLESIGNYAFCTCEKLTDIVIPDSVTSLGKNAFSYCPALESVTLGMGITEIKDETFSDCGALTDIIYKGTVEQWNNLTKGLRWNEATGDYTVTCVGGKVDKNGNPVTA